MKRFHIFLLVNDMERKLIFGAGDGKKNSKKVEFLVLQMTPKITLVLSQWSNYRPREMCYVNYMSATVYLEAWSRPSINNE